MKFKNIFSIGSMGFACLSLALVPGCANSKNKTPDLELPTPGVEAAEEETPGPVIEKAPSLAGKDWTGYYYRTDKPGRLALTATIKQSKKELKLTTFSNKDKVHALIGSIAPDGQLTLENKIQPAIWTSSFGPASENSLKIVAPIGKDGRPASQIINLRRLSSQ